MKRTTVSLPDDLAGALEREARRRRVSVSQVTREALEVRLGMDGGPRRTIPFAALGRSGHHSTAREVDAILHDDWSIDRDR
jgi:predicted transcriptional regulator